MPEVSVVIPAYGHCPHLPGLVRAVLAGTLTPLEVIVSHTGPGDPTGLIEPSERLRVLHRSERLLGGGARNRGAAAARGAWLAFVDADVLPRADWLARLLEMAERGPGRFVVGSVGYAVSGGYWGLANWIGEFSEQAPWHPMRQQRGGASCNMLVRAEDFRAAGGFPEEYQPGEDTMLFARLTGMGRAQWFEPAARVDHYNQSGLRSFARHQYRLGYHGALIRQRVALRGSLAARVWPGGSPPAGPAGGCAGWRWRRGWCWGRGSGRRGSCGAPTAATPGRRSSRPARATSPPGPGTIPAGGAASPCSPGRARRAATGTGARGGGRRRPRAGL
jgi:GT2 family glycosyltransferase